MKRMLAILMSCVALLSTTINVPALAEAKDEAAQSNVSIFQEALTTAADGVYSVIDGAKTNIAELLESNDVVGEGGNESAQASETTASQENDTAAVIPSNLDGVVWDTNYHTCTLLSGYSVDGRDLYNQISYHSGNLYTFIAEANTGLTGDANRLFYSCEHLSTVNLASSFDTSQVTDMGSMFYGCEELTSLTLPNGFDTSMVDDMSSMFNRCSSLQSLTLPETFDTSSVEDMNRMFYACSALASLALPEAFDTSMVEYMNDMFYACSSLTSLTLPDAFNTSNVELMSSMFDECSSLASLTLPNAFTPTVTTNMNSMFSGCSSLKTLTLPSTFDPSAASEMIAMFMGCSQLEKLSMPVSSSANLTTCVGMFTNCDSLRELNLGNFVPPAGQASLAMFADVDMETGEILGSIPNIEKITMSGACILEPGEGTSVDTASGTFFDYKEPLSWNAYYQDTTADNEVSEDKAPASKRANSISSEPTAVLTGFDEFKAYQETHPGLTTYIFDEQPTPPGPTPDPEPTPDPTPEPIPDVVPATDTDALPLTGDASASLAEVVAAVLMGSFVLLVSGYSFTRKRSV